MKKICLCCITIFLIQPAFSNQKDSRLFQLICENLIGLEYEYYMKENIESIRLLIDPSDNAYFLDTFKPLTPKEIEMLKGVKEDHLIRILKRTDVFIFPLLEKNLSFRDTIGFFEHSYSHTIGDYNFKIDNEETQGAILQLWAIREDDLEIAFSFLVVNKDGVLLNFFYHNTKPKPSLREIRIYPPATARMTD